MEALLTICLLVCQNICVTSVENSTFVPAFLDTVSTGFKTSSDNTELKETFSKNVQTTIVCSTEFSVNHLTVDYNTFTFLLTVCLSYVCAVLFLVTLILVFIFLCLPYLANYLNYNVRVQFESEESEDSGFGDDNV